MPVISTENTESYKISLALVFPTREKYLRNEDRKMVSAVSASILKYSIANKLLGRATIGEYSNGEYSNCGTKVPFDNQQRRLEFVVDIESSSVFNVKMCLNSAELVKR